MMKQKQLKFLLFVNLFSLVGYYTFAPLYALFAHSFGLTPKTISLIWGGYSLLTAVFILLMGKIENKMKKGRMVVLGYFIYALGALSFLLVHDGKSLIIVLALNALGAGVTLPAYKTMFAKSESKGKESEQWSWLDAGNMFAAAIGAGIGGLIIGAFGFHGLFITMATIQILAAFVAYKAFFSKV
jgi:DHA1 family bicyclomycin/chloramphenicol resistance-like MFS transporter